MTLHEKDRRNIAPLLAHIFPQMQGASSEAWNAFLNEQTGLSVGIEAANSSAFDQWRQALARQGHPELWPY